MIRVSGGLVRLPDSGLSDAARVYQQRHQYGGSGQQRRSHDSQFPDGSASAFVRAPGLEAGEQHHLRVRSHLPQSAIRAVFRRLGAGTGSQHESDRRLHPQLHVGTAAASGYEPVPAGGSRQMAMWRIPTFDSKGILVQASGYNAATGQGIYLDTATGKAISKPAVARPDATIGQFNVNESVGHSSYNGTYVSIQRRMSHRVQFGLNYTYAFNRDDDSNERDFNRQYMLNTYNLKIGRRLGQERHPA